MSLKFLTEMTLKYSDISLIILSREVLIIFSREAALVFRLPVGQVEFSSLLGQMLMAQTCELIKSI